MDNEEAAAALIAGELLDRALEITALTPAEAKEVNPSTIGFVPTSSPLGVIERGDTEPLSFLNQYNIKRV